MVTGTVNQNGVSSTNFTEKPEQAEFAARLETLRRDSGIRSISAFARSLNTPITSMRSWLLGENDPSRDNLVRIARHCGVSVEWLATGQGPKVPSSAPQPPTAAQPAAQSLFATVDMPRLSSCLEIIESGFAKHRLIPRTDHKLRLAVLMYDAMANGDAAVADMLTEIRDGAEKSETP